MAKKKSRSKAARQAAAAQAAPAPKPGGAESNVAPIAIGVIACLALGAFLWSRGQRGEEQRLTARDRVHVAADDDAADDDAADDDEAGDESPPPAPPPSGPIDPRLLSPAGLTERAPDTFAVELDTTAGPIVIDVHRAWSPNGADRFYNLVRAGYYTDIAFFRVIDGFMAQCGIHGRPQVNAVWRDARIDDDPVVQHNTRGFVSFATGGPNTRTTQFFINFGDNSRLDASGFSPFGRVRDMAAVDALDDRYGEGAPSGRGPDQGRIQSEGNTYLRAGFPELDYIESATILP